jgi:hypothetical protein
MIWAMHFLINGPWVIFFLPFPPTKPDDGTPATTPEPHAGAQPTFEGDGMADIWRMGPRRRSSTVCTSASTRPLHDSNRHGSIATEAQCFPQPHASYPVHAASIAAWATGRANQVFRARWAATERTQRRRSMGWGKLLHCPVKAICIVPPRRPWQFVALFSISLLLDDTSPSIVGVLARVGSGAPTAGRTAHGADARVRAEVATAAAIMRALGSPFFMLPPRWTLGLGSWFIGEKNLGVRFYSLGMEGACNSGVWGSRRSWRRSVAMGSRRRSWVTGPQVGNERSRSARVRGVSHRSQVPTCQWPATWEATWAAPSE